MALPGGSWQMAAIPSGGWRTFSPFRSVTFGISFMITSFLTLLTFMTLRVGYSRKTEIIRRRTVENDLLRSNRRLTLVSDCNGAIVHACSEADLFDRICRIAVKTIDAPLAVIGLTGDRSGSRFEPVAYSGTETAEEIREHVLKRTDLLYDIAKYSIIASKPFIIDTIIGNPDFGSSELLLRSRNYQSAITVPLTSDNGVLGVIVVFSRERTPVDAGVTPLLEELSGNISHGVTALRVQKEKHDALIALEKVKNELEERVAERTRELLVAKEAAEAADRIKSAFLATMSHELRTPLNSIIGFTGIILKGMVGEITEEQRKQLNMVYESSRHLLALINDVLDISKIESGQIELSVSSFALREVIEKTVGIVMPMAEKKNLAIIVPEQPANICLCSDRRRVEQILINLLNNAVKFTDRGSITLDIRITAHGTGVAATTAGDGDCRDTLEIAVIDTGIGIAPSDMDKLFQPFRQLDTGTTRKFDGTGLGLSICRKLACLLGGDVTARSGGSGKGSEFTLLLPMKDC